MANAAVGNDGAAREDRIAERAIDARAQLSPSGPAHIAEEALQDAEVRSSRRLQGNALVGKADTAEHTELCVLANNLEILHGDDAPVEREANRCRILQRVVEQLHLDRIDRRLHQQVVQVGQLADHPNRPAADPGGVLGQTREKQPEVRIERAVVKPERELAVGLRRERDAAGRRERKTRRGGVEVAAELVAAERQRAGHLSDGFVADGEIIHADLEVVAWHLEGAVAGGRELSHPGNRHLLEPDRLDRSTGIRRPSALNEYVESQPMNAAPVMLPARSKPMSIPLRRMPRPSNRSDAVAFRNGWPYARPSSMVIAPNPRGWRYGPVRCSSPENKPDDRILVELERVPQDRRCRASRCGTARRFRRRIVAIA